MMLVQILSSALVCLSRWCSGTHIHLLVEGATIRIGDIYDRPLALIEAHIRQYWQGK